MIKDKLAYFELREIINLISDEYKNKIPINIRQSLNDITHNESFSLKYDSSGNAVISKNTRVMLLYLYNNYIMNDNPIILHGIDLKLKDNDRIARIIQEKNSSKMVLNDLFPAKKAIHDTKSIENNTQVIRYEKSLFRKIIQKIKSFLGIFNKN